MTVEMEDDIRDGGAYTLSSGDRVTTTGTVPATAPASVKGKTTRP